jgi:hypothetical protein
MWAAPMVKTWISVEGKLEYYSWAHVCCCTLNLCPTQHVPSHLFERRRCRRSQSAAILVVRLVSQCECHVASVRIVITSSRKYKRRSRKSVTVGQCGRKKLISKLVCTMPEIIVTQIPALATPEAIR